MKNIRIQFPYEGHAAIALIELHRPQVLNALSTELMEELVETLFCFDNDPQVRVIILTGNEKAFAAGADIAQLEKATSADQLKYNRFLSWEKLRLIRKPIIAAVDGVALGGGLELAMSCDLIIASKNAQFGQPEIKIGTIPGAGGTQRLTKAVGKSKAMLAILTGEMFSADQAYNDGLIAKVVPSHTLLSETLQIALMIANKAPLSVMLAKEAVNKSFEMGLKEGMDFERRNFYLTFSTDDQKEGMRAFLEKRSPHYKGN